jgi:hypothetical protein
MTMMGSFVGLPNKIPKLILTNNTAFGYGDSIATLPCDLKVLGDTYLQMIPGIDFLNVSLYLKDCLDQHIKGTAKLPLPYILDYWSCSSGRCGIGQTLAPIQFLAFNSESGISHSLTAAQTIRCALSTSNITAHFGVYGSISDSVQLSSSVTIRCLKCGKSQIRIEDSTAAAKGWVCMPCSAGKYIIDPDRDQCQNCPSGESCKICT